MAHFRIIPHIFFMNRCLYLVIVAAGQWSSFELVLSLLTRHNTDIISVPVACAQMSLSKMAAIVIGLCN